MFFNNKKNQNDESLLKNINALRDEKMNIEKTAKVNKKFLYNKIRFLFKDKIILFDFSANHRENDRRKERTIEAI